MKVFLGQLNPQIGALAENAQKIIDATEKAKEQNVDLVIFPELALPGYAPRDLLLRPEFIFQQNQIIEEKLLPNLSIPCVFGAVYQDLKSKNLYNSAYYVNQNKIKKIIHKKLLPNYEVFNESRYFTAGKSNDIHDYVININNKKIALLICEDLLGLENNFQKYFVNPLNILKKTKIDAICCLASSPYRDGQKKIREKIIQEVNDLLNCPVYLVNQFGANDNLIFDGNSVAFCPAEKKGGLLTKNNSLEYPEQYFEYYPRTSEITDLINLKNTKDAILLGIKDYFAKTGFRKALVGLSGGIDSALVTTLAVKALGKENVHVILMPSKYSSQSSISDSLLLINNLEISYEQIEITEILDKFLESTGIKQYSLAEENAQSRIRGMILMGKANENNALVLATGNKSEIAIGYSTLYGDSCGGLAPIGDLWKTEVWELSKTFEEIPEKIISKEPSAELRPEQKDTDSLPEYKILDAIMKLYIEENLSVQAIARHGFDEDLINNLIKKHKINEFKRKQYPPILKVSKRSFGELDWQENICKKI